MKLSDLGVSYLLRKTLLWGLKGPLKPLRMAESQRKLGQLESHLK